MRSGVFKNSILNRIIVVSRKPHGTANRSRLRTDNSSVLPVAGAEVISDVVDVLLCRSWPQRCVWQAVSSMAASQCLHVISQHQLARVYEVVRSAGRSDRAERHSQLEEHSTERSGGGESEGDGSRVVTLSALLPLLASNPSLHHMAHSALSEVVMSRGGLSPEAEQSLLLSCRDDHEKLVQLTELARNHGHRFSRSFYRESLRMVLKQHSSSTDAGGDGESGSSAAVPATAGQLVAMMSGDWEKAVVEADMFWLALNLAREESQVRAICDEMHNSEHMTDESVFVELVQTCLRTAQKLKHPKPRHCHADPSHAVSTLVSHLPSRQPSVSALAFERVLMACADSLQLKMAYDTFSCMTHTHGLAPTRAGLQGLGRLLCSPVLTANHQWRRFRLAFAHRILEVSVERYGGVVPGWVYAECARPFTELLGLRGFQLTYDMCHAAVVREHGDDATVVMDELWGRGLYHALLQSCRVNHGPQLATYLINHMTARGIPPNERTFRHLLKFSVSQSAIEDYITVMARHLHVLSSEEMANLDQPLHSMITTALSHTTTTLDRSDEAVDSTVSQLLETVSSQNTEQHCISHLASLSGVSLQTACTHPDVDSDYGHIRGVNRATA